MDWKNRKYYGVTFASDSQNMRIQHLKMIDGVKTRPFHNVPMQKDEKCQRGWFAWMVSCSTESADVVIYELEKAKRNDGVCNFAEIQPKKRMLSDDIIRMFIDKVSNDSVENIEIFLGYQISADILECLDSHICAVLYYGLSDEEFEGFCHRYNLTK